MPATPPNPEQSSAATPASPVLDEQKKPASGAGKEKDGGDDKDKASKRSAVKLWQGRLKDAKKHWEKDFERIRENQEFAAGFQWNGQTTMNDDRYIANITLRHLREKEAALYARNPKAEFSRRNRLDFALWDGKQETLLQAGMAIQQSAMMMQPPPPQAMALIMDYQHGSTRKAMCTRVGKTLEILYQWMVDEQEPDFKESMKTCVLRALTGGVGWVRLGFEREHTSSLAAADSNSKFGDRAKRAQRILERVDDDKINEDAPDWQELKNLVMSMTQSQESGEITDVSERIVFDFPTATAVIVDPKCRCLKTFDGARWIAQEHMLPLEEVNEFFELDISNVSAEITHYTEDGQASSMKEDGMKPKDPSKSPMVCVWEIFDHRTKSTFFIADGHKDYIQEPGPVEAGTRRFWPIYGLVFNKVVVDPGQKASIYPPSDVQLIRSPQKEWNRTRQELRGQRKANAPKYLTRKGTLNEADIEKFKNAAPNEVIELENIPANMKPDEAVMVFKPAPIDPAVYDTGGQQLDIQLVAGAQQADLGAPQPDVTATASSISEHSKMSTTSDNVDDLDGLLDHLARGAGEIALRNISLQTVQRIVGPGGVFPEDDREDFINEICLQAKAASSGRPNKALEVSNWQILAPLMLQAGANPKGIIQESARRLDDQMDIDQFFPIQAMPGAEPNSPQPPARPGSPNPQPGGGRVAPKPPGNLGAAGKVGAAGPPGPRVRRN